VIAAARLQRLLIEKAVATRPQTWKIPATMPLVNFRFLRVLSCAALAMSAVSGLVSCKTTGSSGDYASNFGNDGGFNPYPGQGAYAQPGSLLPAAASSSTHSHPQYAEAPPPPPPGYEVPGSAPTYTPPPVPGSSSSSVKKSTTSSKPSSTGSTAVKKATTTAAKKPVAKKKPTSSIYTVVKGDTLSAIARKKGTTVAKIKAANGMSSDFLSIGKKLKIP
jgi:LysM repeat protein